MSLIRSTMTLIPIMMSINVGDLILVLELIVFNVILIFC